LHMPSVVSAATCFLICATARAHSWLDCVAYDCPAAGPNSGPQPPAACTCKGYPRNWANVMAGVPFAADRGRDNRPGAAPADGGLVCDAGKEPNPGPGTTIPASMYSAQYPAATLSVGENVRWRWPAKNHANTPQAGTVEVYIANTPNAGDDFTPGQTFAGQMSYSSDNGDCLGLDQSTDTADCQGTWTVPNMVPGRYSIMWWWEFNPGEFYNSCADVMITAQQADPPGGGETDPGAGTPIPDPGAGATPTPPPPPQVVAMTRISFSIDGTPADFPQTVLDNIAIAIATPAGVGITDVRVAVGTYSYGTDQYSASSAYSTLAEGVLLTADIAHPSETERLVGEAALAQALPTAAAASAMLAIAGASGITVLETPVIAAIDGDGLEPPQDSGGSNGVVIGIVVVIVVLLIVGGAA